MVKAASIEDRTPCWQFNAANWQDKGQDKAAAEIVRMATEIG